MPPKTEKTTIEKLPADTKVTEKVTDKVTFTTVEYRSTELQPNGLPRFSAGITFSDSEIAKQLLLETIKSNDAGYDEVTKKLSWQ